MKDLEIIILAAGKGSRMKTKTPKLLNKINGKSLIEHTINNAQKIKNAKINIIINKDLEILKKKYKQIKFIKQNKAQGTGHAVKVYLQQAKKLSNILIMMGDAPFISIIDIKKILKQLKNNALVVLGSKMKKNLGNGLIILKDNFIKEIKEFKLDNKKDSNSNYYNTGIFGVQKEYLKLINQIKKNKKLNEFLITDLLKIAYKNKIKNKLIKTYKNEISFGINTFDELRKIENVNKV